jgi:hypothetical protein
MIFHNLYLTAIIIYVLFFVSTIQNNPTMHFVALNVIEKFEFERKQQQRQKQQKSNI